MQLLSQVAGRVHVNLCYVGILAGIVFVIVEHSGGLLPFVVRVFCEPKSVRSDCVAVPVAVRSELGVERCDAGCIPFSPGKIIDKRFREGRTPVIRLARDAPHVGTMQ